MRIPKEAAVFEVLVEQPLSAPVRKGALVEYFDFIWNPRLHLMVTPVSKADMTDDFFSTDTEWYILPRHLKPRTQAARDLLKAAKSIINSRVG